MANPFLVLGGVAVGVVTAGIGVLQVPGWIDSANDSAVRNDLSQIAIGQEAAYTVAANYTDLPGLQEGTADDNSGEEIDTGVEIQISSGVGIGVTAYDTNDEWAAVGVSKSGHVFVRTSDSADVYQAVDTESEAIKVDGSATEPFAGLTFENSEGDALSAEFTVDGSFDAPTISFTPVTP